MSTKPHEMRVEPTYVVELNKNEFDNHNLSTYQFILDNRGRNDLREKMNYELLTEVDPKIKKFLLEQVESVLLTGELDKSLFNALSKYSPHATVIKCSINSNVDGVTLPSLTVRIPPSASVTGFEALKEKQARMQELNEVYGDKVRFNLYNHIHVYNNQDRVNVVQTSDYIENTFEDIKPKELIQNVESSYEVIRELQEHSRLVSIQDLTRIENYLAYYKQSAVTDMNILVKDKKITRNESIVLEEVIKQLSNYIVRPVGTSFDAEKYHAVSDLHHGDPIWVSNIFRDSAGIVHINDPSIPGKAGLGDPHIDSIRCRQSALSLLTNQYAKSCSFDKAIDNSLEWYASTFMNDGFNTKPVGFDFRTIFKDIGIVHKDLTKSNNLIFWSIVNGLSGIRHAENSLGVQVNRRAIKKVIDLSKEQDNSINLPEVFTESTNKKWRIDD